MVSVTILNFPLFSGRSEYTDEEKEAVSLLNKFISGSINLRELDRIPKFTNNESQVSTKTASLVRQVDKQQVSYFYN